MPLARNWLQRPWAIAGAVAVALGVAYLIAAPPAADLAAATYRSNLFARMGYTTWDTGWYAAHGYWLPGYSLLSPALGAWLGVRVLLALSALAASALFALIAECLFGLTAARIAAALFALGFCVGMLSGRVPYDLGFAIGLGAVLALMHGRFFEALGLAVLTSIASPVAGAFLALAGLAGALGGLADGKRPHEEEVLDRGSRCFLVLDRGSRRCLALTVAALTPTVVLGIAYPEGGYEPFAASAFWPALAGVLLIALLLPQGPLNARARGTLRVGAALYALALIGAYAIHTPMGGNAARLGPLLAMPLLAGVLWERSSSPDEPLAARAKWRLRRPRALLLALIPLLLYWQLATPVRDYNSIAGDPSVHASYYAPLLAELRQLRHEKPTIVEVALTKAHWESAYLAGHDGISLARGWERQLDTRYAAIFYRKTLTPSAYRAWLAENKVMYVALPDAPLDKAGSLEGALIARGVPYLRELWHSRHWRLYKVTG